MTDLSKQLLEKAHGGAKLNPDEQRRYLGTFEERVLGYADIDTANSPQLEKGFLSILEKSEPLEDSLKNASLYLEHTAANIGHLLTMRKI